MAARTPTTCRVPPHAMPPPLPPTAATTASGAAGLPHWPQQQRLSTSPAIMPLPFSARVEIALLRALLRAPSLAGWPASYRGAASPTAATTAAAAAAAMPPPPASIRALQPRRVWKFFERLAGIPRPSKREGRVLDFLRDFASDRGLQHASDAVGNLVIHKAGQAGGERAPPVIVQGHVDMVTESDAARCRPGFNFAEDPIDLVVFEGRRLGFSDGDGGGGGGAAVFGDVANGGGGDAATDTWVRADGTTLGADNGIGVAMALALLDDTASPLPPLQCLFTVDEETGLTGAFGLDPGALGLDAATLVNLDTEEWGIVYNGCAGGGTTNIVLPLEVEDDAAAASTAAGTAARTRCVLEVGGLRGGHSGVNIHESRANAVKLCAEAGAHVCAGLPEDAVRLVSVDGGLMHNAIPRECRAVLDITAGDVATATALLDEYVAAYVAPAYGGAEPGLAVRLQPLPHGQSDGDDGAAVTPALCQSTTRRALDLLNFLPSGPLKFSHWALDPAGRPLVETSNNVASVATTTAAARQRRLEVVTSARSFFGPAVDDVTRVVAGMARSVGAAADCEDAYPAWAPADNSRIVTLAAAAVERHTGRRPQVAAIHAGLECGVIMERMPGGKLDAVSFGPVIEEAHTPNERVHVPTVAACYAVLQDLMRTLALGGPEGEGQRRGP